MVHWPNPGQDRYVDAVRGLAALLEDGSIRAIGVSNFTPAHLQRVEEETGLVPDLNQIQLSPYASRRAHRDHHRQLARHPPGGHRDRGRRALDHGAHADAFAAQALSSLGRILTRAGPTPHRRHAPSTVWTPA